MKTILRLGLFLVPFVVIAASARAVQEWWSCVPTGPCYKTVIAFCDPEPLVCYMCDGTAVEFMCLGTATPYPCVEDLEDSGCGERMNGDCQPGGGCGNWVSTHTECGYYSCFQ